MKTTPIDYVPSIRALLSVLHRNSYYRHFTLYKHIFTTKVNVVIEQRHPHGVEEPPLAPPLSSALMMMVSKYLSCGVVTYDAHPTSTTRL